MIKTPRLVIDPERIDGNISKMLRLCQKWGMEFRPHFKTHQSAAISRIFSEKGVEKCTVSSVSMARYFAKHSWRDITIAIPINILELDEVNLLAQDVNLTLIVDHEDSCRALISKLSNAVSVLIEIDTGYGRSGLHYSKKEKIQKLLDIMYRSPVLSFQGFLSHTGNSYAVHEKEKGAALFEQSLQQMLRLKEAFSVNQERVVISMGDTPSSTYSRNFSGIDEWRPGNFIFYDMMQYAKGVCRRDDLALVVRCPIIGIYHQRKEFVIYGGGVHLSKESMIYRGQKIYGWIMHQDPGDDVSESMGYPLISLSQEHGVVSASDAFLGTLKIGDLVDVVPVHSCMTADLYPAYHDEKGHVLRKYRSNS